MAFTCAMGMDMGFNTKHHEKADTIAHHDGEGTPPHHHKASDSHHHNDADNHHQQSKSESDKKDNCCTDNVIKFEQLDKAVANAVKANFNNAVFVAIVNVFYLTDALSASLVNKHIPSFRWCFPPPPDIRVSIQSFQI